jgi:hypothetical protein
MSQFRIRDFKLDETGTEEREYLKFLLGDKIYAEIISPKENLLDGLVKTINTWITKIVEEPQTVWNEELKEYEDIIVIKEVSLWEDVETILTLGVRLQEIKKIVDKKEDYAFNALEANMLYTIKRETLKELTINDTKHRPHFYTHTIPNYKTETHTGIFLYIPSNLDSNISGHTINFVNQIYSMITEILDLFDILYKVVTEDVDYFEKFAAGIPQTTTIPDPYDVTTQLKIKPYAIIAIGNILGRDKTPLILPKRTDNSAYYEFIDLLNYSEFGILHFLINLFVFGNTVEYNDISHTSFNKDLVTWVTV